MSPIDRRHFVVGIGALGASTAWPQARAFGQDKETFVYAETEGYHWSVCYVASAADTWSQAGLAPKTVVFSAGRLGVEAMLAGKAEVSIAVDTVFILPAMRGLKPILVAPFSRSGTGARLTIRSDRIKHPQDVKGKTVTTLVGTGTHFFLRQFLRHHGIAEKDVKVINLAPPDMVTALARGDVDAMAWDLQTGLMAVERGQGNVGFLDTSDSGKYWRQHCLMMAHPDFAKNRVGTCDKIALALNLARDIIAKDPQRARQIVSQRTKTTPEQTEKGMSDFDFLLRFDDELLNDLVEQAEWQIENKVATRPPGDLRKFFTDHFYMDGFRKHVPNGVTIKSV